MAQRALQPNTETAIAQPIANPYAAIDAIEEGIAHDVVLPRLHVASGGARNFQDDSGATYGDLDCTVAVSRKSRAYWPLAYGSGESNTAPQCVSHDGRFGDGVPGGNCANCDNAFFSAEGERPACTEMRRLVILTDAHGAFLLTLKPGSMLGWDRYATRLRSSGDRYYSVRTKLSLEQAQNRAGVRFTRVVPTKAGDLAPSERADMLAQYDSWASLLASRAIESYDAETEDSEPADEVV